jgi:sugar O-acyltransferase (sialic acid O-acetyltransferase NeuD family)
MSKKDEVVIIGYSGHSFVAIDILILMGMKVKYYVDKEEKKLNPFGLIYKGSESENLDFLKDENVFIAIGDNKIRGNLFQSLDKEKINFFSAVHPRSNVSPSVRLGYSVMIGAGASINSLAEILNGVIVNTGAVVEHECKLGEFVHIAPGAVLSGNVQVGHRSFIGANSVVKQGIKIGSNVVIGAGTVVIKDVPDNVTMVGNPQRIL